MSGSTAHPSGPGPARLLPLIVSTGVLALLVVALVVVTVRHDQPKHPGSGTALIDPCLVGTWRTVTDREQVDVRGVGLITMVGQGLVVHIGADGSDVEDYATATAYQGQANGHTVSITITGTVHSTLRTDAGTLSFHGLAAQGTVKITVDGVPANPEPLQVNADPVGYTCAGDTSTETTSQYSSRLVRLSSTP